MIVQDHLSSCTAASDQQDQQPSQRQVEQSVMPPAEQADLESCQAAAQEPLMAAAVSSSTTGSPRSNTGQTSAAGAEPSSLATCAAAVHDATAAMPGFNHSGVRSTTAVDDAATATPSCDHIMARSTTAVGGAATAAQYGSPPTLRPIRTCRSSSSDVPKREHVSMSISSEDPGHLAARQIGLQASGRANSMHSSPIFGLASGSSQAFTPAQDRTAQMPKQGLH